MKKVIAGFLVIMFLITGCAGKTPNPVPQYQPGDEMMDCGDIYQEITDNQQRMFQLYPKTQKTGKNVALGVTGAFFIVPLFFMDFSDAERIEIEAFQRRDSYLHLLARKKGCKETPAQLKLETQAKDQKKERK